MTVDGSPPSEPKPGDIYISYSELSNQDRDGLLSKLTADNFSYWYQKRRYRRNIQNGQAYFNKLGHVPLPERHSPSSLLQCHRKVTYRQLNAPEEQTDPLGIYWFGDMFEEALALPFLREAVTDEGVFVTNSIWVDYTRETCSEDVQIKGSTDPVIVDDSGTPILPTEIKTKSSVDNIEEPNLHHRAQLHAYLVGLNEKYDLNLTDGVLIYGARKSLDIAVFHVEFDREFWERTVLQWAGRHTQYRLDQALPPADPEYDWECDFCEYRDRCGKGQAEFSDYAPQGLLPRYDSYPREKVIKYLEGHPDQALTPILAQNHPSLVKKYGVSDWFCNSCGLEISWEKIDKDNESPLCPQCAGMSELSPLRLPQTDEWGPKRPE